MLSPAEKRNRKVMKIGKFKKMLEKAIKENDMTDKDEILIVNAGEDGAIEAIRVIPNKTIDLINIMVPEYMIDGVRKYMDEYEKNKK